MAPSFPSKGKWVSSDCFIEVSSATRSYLFSFFINLDKKFAFLADFFDLGFLLSQALLMAFA